MAQAILYSKDGKEKGKETLVSSIFEVPANDALVAEYAISYLANQRQGTHKTKTRAEVSGGGVKPWRQKGTGRARSGANTSPIWVRGSKAFGPVPRDYYSLLPVKKRRGALLSVLSMKAKDNKILVIEEVGVTQPKTKEITALLTSMNLVDKKNLIVVDQYDKNLFLATRNIMNTEIRKVAQVNAFDFMNSDMIILTKKSLKALQEKFEKESA